ncbi:MAG: extracellular solute-binding protein [Verrucomicrobia bacterium]|nr:extracellular solute-binding protein [Verrucomicrobiota bacterium]
MCRAIGLLSDTQRTVVVYTALDRNFSEPIFERFEAETGIKVLPKYDTESTKTVGLVNAIIAEKEHPRCDVFWNNEIVNTIRLKQRELLQRSFPDNSRLYASIFKDPDDMWHGFAARARVIIVNTNLVDPANMPESIADLGLPFFRGRAGIAKPLFGTTATHMACLFARLGDTQAQTLLKSLKSNEISFESGNKTCAVKVGQGVLAVALTDTDDAMTEIREGKPVRIIFPDQKEGEMGTLTIPNTLALIKGCPHPEEGKALIDFLLSPEIEELLSQGESSQIPLNSTYSDSHPLSPLPTRLMDVDFNHAASLFERVAAWISRVFLDK